MLSHWPKRIVRADFIIVGLAGSAFGRFETMLSAINGTVMARSVMTRDLMFCTLGLR